MAVFIGGVVTVSSRFGCWMGSVTSLVLHTALSEVLAPKDEIQSHLTDVAVSPPLSGYRQQTCRRFFCVFR